LSWITDVSSALQLGFEPLLCDCNLYDLSPDLDKLEMLFIKENPGSLILVSVLGLIPDMFTIKRLCNEYDVVLIEDVCESMASTYWGRNLGTFGTVSVFSTYFGHAISTIEGGFVNTDEDEFVGYNLIVP